MLIDSHCHLTDEGIVDVASCLERARAAGVVKVCIPAGDIESSRKGIDIAEKTKQYAMVGVHPESIEELYKDTAGLDFHGSSTKLAMTIGEMIDELEGMTKSSERVVGIGEIGLDFFIDKEKKTKDKQIAIFVAQMELAVKLNLPVVIHMRDAEMEMVEALNGFKVLPRGQFHCFAGSAEFLQMILGMGFFVSFAGNITFKSAGNLRGMLKHVPLNRLLLETDTPYLSPEPLRGRPNEPANVKIIATAIAKELEIDIDKLADQTTKNAICLYSLDI